MEQKKKPEGFVILQIGRPRTGKTTETKKHLQIISEKDPYRTIHILDPNLEFTEFLEEGEKPIRKWSLFEPTIRDVENTITVIEEATICLDPRKKEGTVLEMIIKKRHDNNIMILNFHSWRTVPHYIIDFCDFITIFKTQDSDRAIKDRCDWDTVFKAFKRVQNNPSRFYKETIDLNA